MLQSLVMLTLAGQLWSSSFSFYEVYFNLESEIIEVNLNGENDSENEDSKEELDDKIRKLGEKEVFLFSKCNSTFTSSINFNLTQTHPPEINTPPPKQVS